MRHEKSPAATALGQTIHDSRVEHSWTQVQLAEQAGVSRPTVARVERGDDVSTATLTKIAAALGLKIALEDGGN